MTTSICTVRDKPGTTPAAALSPPSATSAQSATDAADLSRTLTPDPADTSAISQHDTSAISQHDASAISQHDTSAISSLYTSAASRTDSSALSPALDGSVGEWPESESVLDSWLRGDSESESESVEEAGAGGVRFWHGDLTRLDHRLQLYLDMNVLQADEQVVCVCKVSAASC